MGGLQAADRVRPGARSGGLRRKDGGQDRTNTRDLSLPRRTVRSARKERLGARQGGHDRRPNRRHLESVQRGPLRAGPRATRRTSGTILDADSAVLCGALREFARDAKDHVRGGRSCHVGGLCVRGVL